MLSIARFPLGLIILVGVPNTENAKQVTIRCLNVHVRFNQSLPLLYHWPKLVGRQSHTMEVGEDIATLHIFSDELELPERPLRIIILLKVSNGNFKHTALETLRGDFCKL